jgi:hypothetical protein
VRGTVTLFLIRVSREGAPATECKGSSLCNLTRAGQSASRRAGLSRPRHFLLLVHKQVMLRWRGSVEKRRGTKTSLYTVGSRGLGPAVGGRRGHGAAKPDGGIHRYRINPEHIPEPTSSANQNYPFPRWPNLSITVSQLVTE